MLELLIRSRKFLAGLAVALSIVMLGVVGPMFTQDPLKRDYYPMQAISIFNVLEIAGEPLTTDELSARLPTIPENDLKIALSRMLDSKIVEVQNVGEENLWAINTSMPIEEVKNKLPRPYGPQPPSKYHPLGTDDFSCDVLAKLCEGIRNSLMVGVIAGFIGASLAILVGGIGPYIGGLADDISNGLTNFFLVLPMLPLLIVLVKILQERSLLLVAVLIGCIPTWPWAARSIRSQVLSLKEREFVNIARMSGAKDRTIAIFEVLPNMLSYVVMVFVIGLSIAILTEAGMSMIGVGPEPGQYVTIGTMLYWVLNTSSGVPWDFWWWFIPPGLVLTTLLVGIYVMHSGMDEVFNPRLRRV